MTDEKNNQVQDAAIVTGGGRGIGRAITLRLAQGMAVVVVGRTAADLESVCNECAERGGTVVAFVGDITDPATAAGAVEMVASRGWTLRHLVCNAGIGKSGPTAEFDEKVWRHVFDVNVHGCFHMVRACLPKLLGQAGSAISIISSLAGTQGVAYDAAYTASKHALVGFARSLELEYAKQGLIVAALCPSFIQSDMTERTIRGVMRRRGLSRLEAEQRVADRCPAKRILPADEIAETVALIGAGKLVEAAALAAEGGYPLINTLQTVEE